MGQGVNSKLFNCLSKCVRSSPSALRFYCAAVAGLILFAFAPPNCFSQTSGTMPFSSQQQFTSGQTSSGNYLKNSNAFRQEIMRMEINVVRGNQTLPITQVPRVQKSDVIKMHLVEESTGGIKPDQSMWNWTFLVAFVNPNRKTTGGGSGDREAKEASVSQEIQFRKSGWYKEYSFVVPYDSQPVFFLYPKPKYRGQILKLVNKKYEEVRKLGEKTIDLANAYSRIDSFLSELQSVMYRTQSSYYGNFITYPKQSAVTTTTTTNSSSTYNPYGTTYNPFSTTYNPYSTSNPYGTTGAATNNQQQLDPSYNYNAFFEQTIERLAASFNINLPNCWQTYNGGYNYFGTPGAGGYNSYGSGYNSGGSYGSSYGGSYGIGGGSGNNANSFGHAVSSEFVGRAQCVASNIRMEDFDFSVSKLLQEGGIFAATQLRDKYPQLAYYINLAAVAIEFILRVFQKYPMKIVPTIIQSSDGSMIGNSSPNQTSGFSASYSNPYQSSATVNPSGSGGQTSSSNPPSVKISVYAESQPSDTDQVTAYPVVVHKWQAEPDAEVVSLAPPILTEPCLHAGSNILKSTDLSGKDAEDTFTRDFKLSVKSDNGFRKEFPLKKNAGAGGWELNLTQEDLNSFPKIQMGLDAEITARRGFSEVKSPAFPLPLNTGSSWQIKPEAQRGFAVGGKRTITLQNLAGSCRCLQAVIYKPSFGGQFVFEANAKSAANQLQFSPDGREVSFEIDATYFHPGAGTLEVKTYGDGQLPTTQQQTQFSQTNQAAQSNQSNQQSNILPIKLYPLPPEITDFRIAGGDRQAVITGNRLEQLQWIKVNGKRMKIVGNEKPAANQPNQAATMFNAGNASPAAVPQFNPSAGATERIAVFEDSTARQEGGAITLELGLDDDRSFAYPVQFKVKPARPTIRANADNEIDGVMVSSISGSGNNSESRVNPNGIGNPNTYRTGNARISQSSQRSAVSVPRSGLPVFPVDAKEISVSVENALTDYDFKPENISIETRIENGQVSTGGEAAQASFEVFDWKQMRIVFRVNEQTSKIIGGRRLQFRIRDRARGDSDWYSVRQTFVRFPEIKSVRCTPQMSGQCELKGFGLEYVGQISIDGGQSWYPGANATMQVQPAANSESLIIIPLLQNKNLLQIKFRDYPKMDGISLTDFIFSNSVKNPGKTVRAEKANGVVNQSNSSVPTTKQSGAAVPSMQTQNINVMSDQARDSGVRTPSRKAKIKRKS